MAIQIRPLGWVLPLWPWRLLDCFALLAMTLNFFVIARRAKTDVAIQIRPPGWVLPLWPWRLLDCFAMLAMTLVFSVIARSR